MASKVKTVTILLFGFTCFCFIHADDDTLTIDIENRYNKNEKIWSECPKRFPPTWSYRGSPPNGKNWFSNCRTNNDVSIQSFCNRFYQLAATVCDENAQFELNLNDLTEMVEKYYDKSKTAQVVCERMRNLNIEPEQCQVVCDPSTDLMGVACELFYATNVILGRNGAKAASPITTSGSDNPGGSVHGVPEQVGTPIKPGNNEGLNNESNSEPGEGKTTGGSSLVGGGGDKQNNTSGTAGGIQKNEEKTATMDDPNSAGGTITGTSAVNPHPTGSAGKVLNDKTGAPIIGDKVPANTMNTTGGQNTEEKIQADNMNKAVSNAPPNDTTNKSQDNPTVDKIDVPDTKEDNTDLTEDKTSGSSLEVGGSTDSKPEDKVSDVPNGGDTSENIAPAGSDNTATGVPTGADNRLSGVPTGADNRVPVPQGGSINNTANMPTVGGKAEPGEGAAAAAAATTPAPPVAKTTLKSIITQQPLVSLTGNPIPDVDTDSHEEEGDITIDETEHEDKTEQSKETPSPVNNKEVDNSKDEDVDKDNGQQWSVNDKDSGSKYDEGRYKGQGETREVAPSSGNFMAYFLTAVVLCIAGYVVFHNKQKIIAFIIEGRSHRGRRRTNGGGEYKKLQSNVEEVMPSLDKSTSARNFIY